MLNIITKWLPSQSMNDNLCLYWRCWLYRQCTADFMAGKWRIAYYSQGTGLASCSCFLFFTGGVASALMWRRLRRTPLPSLAFIALGHNGSLPLTVNSSYFALFSLIILYAIWMFFSRLFLLTYSCIPTLCSNPRMVILCCTVKKLASAAQSFMLQ